MSNIESCKYLIYTYWETNGDTGSKRLHDLCPKSEDEAKAMVAALHSRSDSFFDTFVGLRQSRRYVYIENRRETT